MKINLYFDRDDQGRDRLASAEFESDSPVDLAPFRNLLTDLLTPNPAVETFAVRGEPYDGGLRLLRGDPGEAAPASGIPLASHDPDPTATQPVPDSLPNPCARLLCGHGAEQHGAVDSLGGPRGDSQGACETCNNGERCDHFVPRSHPRRPAQGGGQ